MRLLGDILRDARNEKFKKFEGSAHKLAFTGGQREGIAKKASISAGYLSIIECNGAAHVSEDLLKRLIYVLDAPAYPAAKWEKLRQAHNQINSKYEQKRKKANHAS